MIVFPMFGSERSMGDSVGPFEVAPINLRFGANGDYLIQVEPQLRCKIGRRAINAALEA